MSDANKYEIVDAEYNRLKTIIEKSIMSENFEKALAAISVAGSLLYSWNQRYVDNFLEESILKIAERTTTSTIRDADQRNDTILFYDCFGLDTRGLAVIYLKALAHIGNKVYYVVPITAKDKQPEIDKVICDSNVKRVYYSSNRYYDKLKELQEIFNEYKPSKAFLYTLPDDSAGIAAFMQMKKVVRYQINLTDHAFWLGKNAFDYCLEFRNYGASISLNERGISKDRIALMPYYPYIDKKYGFQGFPFETEGKKIIFSGGALYKTIDSTGTFYYIVSEILKKNKDVIFLYAGSGDDFYLKQLQTKFVNRIFYIKERKDLYQILRHVTLYLSTYPMMGGLMMQYAALAGKIPVTLWHGDENSGILINQESRRIEYKDKEELISDVNRILNDSHYREEREALLEGSVISEQEFYEELRNVIDKQRTKYNIDFFSVDSRRFRQDYVDRFSFDNFLKNIPTKRNVSLIREYREQFINRIRGGITKIAKKMITRYLF